MRHLFILFFIISSQLYAKGTGAGTVINNIATLDFIINDTKKQIKSNVVSDTVAQLLDLHIDALDSSDIEVKVGTNPPPLSFQITNTGNGKDSFEISYLLETNSPFWAKDIGVYIDSNNNKIYDNQDKLIDFITLNADENRLFFIVSQITDSTKTSKTKKQNKAVISVKGKSKTGGSGERGRVHKSKGVKGVDAVDGEDGGVSEAKGAWVFKSLKSLSIVQKSSIVNKFGNSEPISGAIITYDIDIYNYQNITAKNVVFKNQIPKNTEYQKNSLKLNSLSLTDIKDSDVGLHDSKKHLIKVDIGHIAANQRRQIQFKVKIK